MASKPRITRLGDPANPYTKRKGGSASPAPHPAEAKPKTPPPAKSEHAGTVDSFFQSVRHGANTLMKNWNDSSGGGARKRKLDQEIRRQGG